MKRGFATLALVTVAFLSAIVQSALERKGIGSAGYRIGYIAGATAFPFLIGGLGAWLMGLVRGASPEAFHRRLNWISLVVVILAVLAVLARLGGAP
jgi:hypothetical protein